MLMGKTWHKYWTFYGTRIAQNRTMRECGQNMVQILVKVWCKLWEKFGPRLRIFTERMILKYESKKDNIV